MTDPEADAWFTQNADYKMVHTLGMTTYQLWWTGKKAPGDDSVGIAIPANAPHPDPESVKRFLVRWFVQAYGA